jgi:3-deoxy-D-manno-octulosonic acid kinase
MTTGGKRIATATGIMLAAPSCLSDPLLTVEEPLFDPQFWAARSELTPVSGGRGAAWFVGAGERQWVLRHYRRGGAVALVNLDRYLWTGEAHVRAFAEWRLLADLVRLELPVPKPVAAWYRRRGPSYRCDLLTERIAAAQSLSQALAGAALSEHTWRRVGGTIARFHKAGVDHADLNAHNILLSGHDSVSLIDFDRGRFKDYGSFAARNLDRLQRSLRKIAPQLPPGRYAPAAWEWLLEGYQA